MALLKYYPIIHFPSSPPSFPLLNDHHPSTPKLFKLTKASHIQISVSLSPPSSSPPPPPNTSTVPQSSTSPIFLPFLQGNSNSETELNPPQESSKDENFDSKVNRDDPLIRFFKSQTSNPNPDPGKEGKISLRKNRKSSWHLAFETGNSPQGDEEIENFQLGSPLVDSNSVSTSESKVGGMVREIFEKAKTLPDNSTLGEVLGGFQGKVSEKDCWEVLGMLGEEGLIRSCVYFFEWMRLQEPFLVSPRACSVLFPLLGLAGMGDEILVLFRNLPDEKRFGDVHIYNAAISGLLGCGRYDDAWGVYKSMETNNVQPDHVTCSIMVTVLRKKGNSAKDAWELVEKMKTEGVKWSLEVSGALIKSFCEEGLKKEALIIQSDMEKRGISSNAVVYNTIMDAYCKSNKIEEAEGLFVEMKAAGISPTAASYNILMDAYSRRMQPEIVEKLMLEMENVGLEPNVKSYTCLISAYGRQKKMSDMAADAFLKMKKVGIIPTSHSYTALIHAYSVSGWHEKAYLAFENMQKEGIKPSIETYTALLDAYRRAGDTQMLMEIWKLMIRNKIDGTRVTFNILLDGFAKQGHYVEARDVMCEFRKIGFEPTIMTYNMLVNAYARGGQESKLPQLLKEMAALQLKPDSITYSTMIYAYLRVRDFRRAFFYHKQMVKSGQVPDAKSYEKLRAILDAKAKIKNRRDKSALMGIINSSLGLMKQKKKRKKDEFWKNRKKRSRTHGTAKAGS